MEAYDFKPIDLLIVQLIGLHTETIINQSTNNLRAKRMHVELRFQFLMNHVNHIYELSIEILENFFFFHKSEGTLLRHYLASNQIKNESKNQIMQSPEGNIFHAKKTVSANINLINKKPFEFKMSQRIYHHILTTFSPPSFVFLNVCT